MQARWGRRTTIGLAAAVLAVAASPANAERYLVVYQQQRVPADAAKDVERAGGQMVSAYGQIGVVVAESDAADFAHRLRSDAKVDAVGSTSGFGTRIESVDSHDPEGDLPHVPAADADTFSGFQWDMRQISAPQAHAITGGSRAVLAGDIDTGADYRHPDLSPNLDFASSVSCVGGVPNQAPTAWDDDSGHGTHTAGTIAAAANGVGIVGTAPNVRLGVIDVADAAGFFFPEAVVCGFVWAGDHGFDVVNNSYFADPFLYNCHNDPVQQAIYKAELRAVRYAMNRGVTVVASAGNSNQDLSHPPLGNQCVRIPSELPGVITVSADGALRQKAFYSNYGISEIDVVAPGGDSLFQVTPEAPNGRVLSTYPGRFSTEPGVFQDPASPGAYYRHLQGTSMAAPHVTGVAALVISRYGSAATPQNGKMRPGEVAAYIQQTADPRECPPNPFRAGTAFEATCEGGAGHNSFYGGGQVNALRAVTHDTGG